MAQIKEILHRLIHNSLTSSLARLEIRTIEHMDSIQQTSSLFDEFKHQLNEIAKEQEMNPSKPKKLENTNKDNERNNNSSLVLNYTMSNFNDKTWIKPESIKQKRESKIIKGTANPSKVSSHHSKTECCDKKKANNAPMIHPYVKPITQFKSIVKDNNNNPRSNNQSNTLKANKSNAFPLTTRATATSASIPLTQKTKLVKLNYNQKHEKKLIHSKTMKEFKDTKIVSSNKNLKKGKQKLNESIKNTTIRSTNKKNVNGCSKLLTNNQGTKTNFNDNTTGNQQLNTQSTLNDTISDNYSFALNADKPVYSVVLDYLNLKEKILLFSSCKLFKTNLNKIIQKHQQIIQSRLNGLSIDEKIKEITNVSISILYSLITF